jgi:hypothetical protein
MHGRGIMIRRSNILGLRPGGVVVEYKELVATGSGVREIYGKGKMREDWIMGW